MEKSKIDFISDLLASNRLDSSMKQKFFELTAREIKAIKTDDSKIWEEINKLKVQFAREIKRKRTSPEEGNLKSNQTEFFSEQKNEVNKGDSKITLPVFHDPKSLVSLLSKFSENNHPLKYTCHHWDYGKVEDLFENYEDFINQFDERGRSICFDIQKIKKNLGAKILHFLNTPNENGFYKIKDEEREFYWGEFRMKYGWKSRELAEWAKLNVDKDPFDFPLPTKIMIKKRGKPLDICKFGDVVKVFKEEIEFRPEESSLFTLMAELRRKHLGFDFNVRLDDTLRGKQFYTDVHEFKRALNKVFIEMSKRTIAPNVEIMAFNHPEEGSTTIEIVHEGSNCSSKSSDDMLMEILDGDFADVMGYLKNLCDWSIESRFVDGSFRLNYLTSDIQTDSKIPIPNTQDFKHVFKFYK